MNRYNGVMSINNDTMSINNAVIRIHEGICKALGLVRICICAFPLAMSYIQSWLELKKIPSLFEGWNPLIA